MTGKSLHAVRDTELFQLVRALERKAIESGHAGARRGAVGYDEDPKDEVARFRVRPTLSFAPVGARPSPETGGPREILVSLMGTIGADGVLPFHYTELALQRLALRDPSMVDFLDLFHHRSLSLFHRAWKKYRLPFAFEQSSNEDVAEGDPTGIFLSLVGLGTNHLREDLPEGAETWMYFAAHFARRQRTADGLEALLEEYVRAPVRVEQFVGRWKPLLGEDCTRLSSGPDGNGRHDRLGESVVLGNRAWDVKTDIRIHVGPIDSTLFSRLFEERGSRGVLVPVVRSYLDGAIAFEIVCHVDPETIESCRLGEEEHGASALGRSCWLCSRDPESYEVEVPIWLDNSRERR